MTHNPSLTLATLFLVVAACGGKTEDSGNSSGGAAAGGSASGGASGSVGGNGAGAVGPSAGTSAIQACKVPSECVLRPQSCCGSCGAPTRSDVVALNNAALAKFADGVCGNYSTCPACAAQRDNTLLATCEQGQCVGIDLLTHPSTACSDASECYVRAPECCPCGGSTDEYSLIALSSTSSFAYEPLVCDPQQACDDCFSYYPNVQVDCIGGHCQVVR